MAKSKGKSGGMKKGTGASGFGKNKDLSTSYIKSPSAAPMKGCK